MNRNDVPPWLAVWCRTNGVELPTPEHRFHPERKYRLDFAWVPERVGLELHGAVWRGGHHTRGRGFTDDRAKMNAAVVLGWRVIEVTTDQVKDGSVYRWLDDLLIR